MADPAVALGGILPPTAYEASEWSDLFVSVAGASAALAGLVFVAISIIGLNPDQIVGGIVLAVIGAPRVPGRIVPNTSQAHP